jgi:predicted dehydrogenase
VNWICDLDPKARDAFCRRHPHAQATDRLDDVLRDDTIQAVAIVTPTETHYDITKATLLAGKHALVEKPITTNSDHARELAALAENQGLILMVGHVFQYNSSIHALKELIVSGELGEINYISLERTNLGPIRTDVSALWDLVSHDAYIMADLLQEVPSQVSAVGRDFLNKSIYDIIFATYIFSSGAVAHVHASWLNPRKVRQITAVGSAKMAVWDDLNMEHPIQVYDKRVEIPDAGALEGSFMEFKTLVVDGGVTTPSVKLNRPLQAECEHFIDCVEQGLKPLSDGWSGLDVVNILTATEDSMTNQGVLTLIG